MIGRTRIHCGILRWHGASCKQSPCSQNRSSRFVRSGHHSKTSCGFILSRHSLPGGTPNLVSFLSSTVPRSPLGFVGWITCSHFPRTPTRFWHSVPCIFFGRRRRPLILRVGAIWVCCKGEEGLNMTDEGCRLNRSCSLEGILRSAT